VKYEKLRADDFRILPIAHSMLNTFFIKSFLFYPNNGIIEKL